MAINTTPSFDAPIPGMSLTAELGGRPWQTPAQYTTVDEAVQYYMDRMTSEEFMDQVIDVIEMGVPLTSIANTIQLASVMDGLHSVDVGVMVTPVLVEMMMFMAESAGVEYVSGLDDPEKGKISKAKMAKILQELEREVGELDEPEVIEELKDKESDEKEEMPKGLMARRK